MIICAIVVFVFLIIFSQPSDAVMLLSADYEAKKSVIIDDIKKTIPENNLITYTTVPRGIVLSVAQSELFYDKSSKISPKGEKILAQVALLLNNFDNNCTIESHTDENTKNDGNSTADWEISVIRANVIAKYLINELKVDTSRIFSIGFGNSMPFNDNVANHNFTDSRIDFVIFDYTVER